MGLLFSRFKLSSNSVEDSANMKDQHSEPPPRDPALLPIIEKWENLEALRAHFTTPHMLTYRENVKDIVEGISLKVLKEA